MAAGEDRRGDVATPLDDAADESSPSSEPAAATVEDQYVELLPSREPFRTLTRLVGLVEQIIGGALIVVILVLVLIQVAQRYVHAFDGWPWTGEIARLALVWCTFVLSGYLMAQDRHITIKVADLVLPEWVLDLVKLGSHVVVLVTCLGMGYATYSLIANDIGQRTPAAELPIAWFYVMPLVGFLLTALRAMMMIGLVDVRQVMRRGERAA